MHAYECDYPMFGYHAEASKGAMAMHVVIKRDGVLVNLSMYTCLGNELAFVARG